MKDKIITANRTHIPFDPFINTLSFMSAFMSIRIHINYYRISIDV